MENANDKNNALEYSEDDEMETGKGWYWQQQHGEWFTSQLFETAEKAIEAMNEGTVKFGA